MSLSPDMIERIEKLAQYVAHTNGQMEDTVRERQRTNPSFSFLFGGEGAGYYKECLRKFSSANSAAACGPGPASTASMGMGFQQFAVGPLPPSGTGCGPNGSGTPVCGGPGCGGPGCGGPGFVVGGSAPGGGYGTGYGMHGAMGAYVGSGGMGGGGASGDSSLPPYLGAYRRIEYDTGGGGGGGGGGMGGLGGGGMNGGGGIAAVEEERIFSLLERRDECRRRRDWDGADRLKDELLALNVLVNDKERSWTVRAPLPSMAGPSSGCGAGGAPSNGTYGACGYGSGGGYSGGGFAEGGGSGGGLAGGQFRGPSAPASRAASTLTHDYTRSGNDNFPVDVTRVNELIAGRMNAKITRDFERADALRMELRQLGVEVHDRDKVRRTPWALRPPTRCSRRLPRALPLVPSHSLCSSPHPFPNERYGLSIARSSHGSRFRRHPLCMGVW